MTVMEQPPSSMDPERTRNPISKPAFWHRFVGKWWFWGGLGIVVLVAVGAALALLIGDDGSRRAGSSVPPLIRADSEPVKLRPERPGGMEVPNRDKLVYRRLEGLAEPPVVEKLLPEPEEPLPPPRPKPAPQPESAEPTPPETAFPSGTAGTMVEPPTEATQDKIQDEAQDKENALAKAPSQVDSPAELKTKPNTGYQIQLVAVRKREQAEGMWKTLKGKHADVFANLEPDIARADLGKKGVMYRLRAGPIDSEARARSLCADLGRRKVDCLVVRTGG